MIYSQEQKNKPSKSKHSKRKAGTHLNRVVKKILKIFAWIIGCIILLIILVLIAIQIPAVQNFAKNKVVTYLQNKIKTKVVIDNLSIAFPKQIVLKGVYFEDQKKDTLLYGKELRVDIALLKLLSSELSISYIELDGIRSHIYRTKPDTTFNFEYIAKAFASEQTKEPKPADTTSTMKFHLGKIVLNDIGGTFKDDVTGNDAYFYLGNFNTQIDKFDLDHMAFEIPSINVSNINAGVYQYKPLITLADTLPAPATSLSVLPSLKLDAINFRNINFNYKNDISVMLADLHLGELSLHPENLNLQSLLVQLKDISLKNTTAKIVMGKTAQATKAVVANETANTFSIPWKVQLGKIDFSNNNFAFDDDDKPRVEGMDFGHLNIKGFVFTADSLTFTPVEYSGTVNQLAFTEKSGFHLKTFKTKFLYNDKQTFLKNLLLQTDGTEIKDNIILQYPSVEMMAKKPGEIYIDANIKQSSITMKDILTFIPAFKRNVRGHENAVIRINTAVKGYVKNLAIPVFEISGYGNTYAKISGTIKGLPDANKTYYDIKIDRLSSTKNDLIGFIPPKQLASFRLPDIINASGFFKGSMKAFNTQLAIKTNRGNIDVVAGMKPHDAYSAKLTLNNLQAGYLLKQEKTIGNITMNATVNGAGLDMNKANVTYNANIISAQLQGYDYKNLSINGSLKNGIAQTEAKMNDANIAFNLNATADIKPKFPSLQLNLLIDTLNLQALHFADSISMHGHIVADMPVTNPDSLVGTLNINDLVVTQANRTFAQDSIALVATASPQQKTLDLNTNFLKMNLAGRYKLTELGTALQHTINKYYNLPGFKDTAFAAENWELNASFIPTGLVLQLMPDLKGTDSIAIKTTYNSAANDLSLSIKNNRFIYAQQQIDSLNINAQTAADKLNFGLTVNGVRTPSLNLYKTALTGYVADNMLHFGLNVKDKKNTSQYLLAGALNQIKDGIKFSLNADSVVLDYSKWTVGSNNFIQYDSVAGILVNNFSLSNAGQSLTINSTPQTANAPIEVKFSNFSIATLTKIAHQDSLLLEGVINGNAIIKNATKNPVFTSDLHIDSVVYKNDTLGNIAIKVNNETANAFAANVSIEGAKNDIKLDGIYYTGESRMDLKLAINRLDLSVAKPFAVGQLNDIGGNLKGNINMQGTLDKPQVNGSINFENAFIVPTITGERFTLSNDNINIDGQGIHFNNFTLRDSANDEAIIKGDVLTTDFKNYRFAVDFDAENFRAVNSKKSTNQLFYGKLNINAHMKVRGDMESPVVTANFRVNKETDFTMILPTVDPEVESREGVVKFVDKDHPTDTLVVKTALDSLSNQTELKGLDVNVNIETDSAARFTVIVDERSGDALTVKGRADLNGGIDKSGKITLTGNYVLQSGQYNLSLSLLKRSFEIQQGSTLVFTGDPTSANVDITAIYTANAASIDLIGPQLTGRPQSEVNRFKERLPFKVNLKMTGELLKPIITFDITLPDEELSQWPEIDTKLQQIRTDESELNKQVFALLLLGRFVGENPLQSEAEGPGIAGSIRQSASSILTNQLNQLAGNLIKGVDLNFDLTSDQDYSTGQAVNNTSLNVGVSKSVLNDRIRVNVGSNFELEGAQNSNRSASNIAGDVSVDYQLSKDGRYRLRAYRKNEYEGVVEGQVIETGVSFILTFDYDKFKELFSGRKPKEQPKKEKQKKDIGNQQQP